MSELCCAKLIFDVGYSLGNIRQILDACAVAVDENWTFADEWTRTEDNRRIDVEKWLAECGEEKLEKALCVDELWKTKSFDFSYSPTSFQICMVSFSRESRSGGLGMRVCVPDWSVKFENKGYRETQRMDLEWEEIRRARGEDPFGKIGPDENHPKFREWWERHDALEKMPDVWPQNRKCFINIVGKVRSLFPVKEIRLDAVFQETV